MKIALICPSNKLFMPYVRSYENILTEYNMDYDVMIWDRFDMENRDNPLIYRDSKVGHQRNYLDYYKYCRFIRNRLATEKYDKVIVFGIQLTYFLKRFLHKHYLGRYIVDIRDFNRALKLFHSKKVIDGSQFTVISSPGFQEWLPVSNKYLVNHNTSFDCLELLDKEHFWFDSSDINISYIGTLRDLDVNIDFINSLKNKDRFKLVFHGEGTINHALHEYVEQNAITNVIISGRYDISDEKKLYSSAHLVNMLMYNKDINSRTLLANRLYNSVVYGKPMLALSGTYLSDIVKRYDLGLVLDSLHQLEEKILNYLSNFSTDQYMNGRKRFFEMVCIENNIFKEKLKDFCST